MVSADRITELHTWAIIIHPMSGLLIALTVRDLLLGFISLSERLCWSYGKYEIHVIYHLVPGIALCKILCRS